MKAVTDTETAYSSKFYHHTYFNTLNYAALSVAATS
jgi:hypothetical protein